MPVQPIPPKKEEPEKPKDKEEVIQTSLPSRARLIIDLPADAKLYIDDRLTKSSSARRTFTTPALNHGDTYYYELRVEVVRNGVPMIEDKKVTLKVGDVIRADFRDMERTATAKASKK